METISQPIGNDPFKRKNTTKFTKLKISSFFQLLSIARSKFSLPLTPPR